MQYFGHVEFCFKPWRASIIRRKSASNTDPDQMPHTKVTSDRGLDCLLTE